MTKTKGQGTTTTTTETKPHTTFGEKLKHLFHPHQKAKTAPTTSSSTTTTTAPTVTKDESSSKLDYYVGDQKGTKWSSSQKDISTAPSTTTTTTSTTNTGQGQGEMRGKSSQGPTNPIPPATTTSAIPVGTSKTPSTQTVTPSTTTTTTTKPTTTTTPTSQHTQSQQPQPQLQQQPQQIQRTLPGGLQEVVFVDQYRGPQGVQQPVIVRRIAPADELSHFNDYFAPIDNQLTQNLPPSAHPSYAAPQQRGIPDSTNIQITPTPGVGTHYGDMYGPLRSHGMMWGQSQPVSHRRSLSQPVLPCADESFPQDEFNNNNYYRNKDVFRSESANVIPVSSGRSRAVKVPITTTAPTTTATSRDINRRPVSMNQPRSIDVGRGYHPEDLPLKQRGKILEDDLRRFYHEKEEEFELLEKEPILTAPAKHRARLLESDLVRLRHEKEEEQEYLEENPIASQSVKQRAILLAPMLLDAEVTKHKMRPLIQSEAGKGNFNNTNVSSTQDQHGIMDTVKEKATEMMEAVRETAVHAPETVKEAFQSVTSSTTPTTEGTSHPGVFGTALNYIERAAEAVKEGVYHAMPGAPQGEQSMSEDESRTTSSEERSTPTAESLANKSRSFTHMGDSHQEEHVSDSTVVEGDHLIPPAPVNQNTFTTRTSTSNNPNNAVPQVGDTEIKYL